jgi:hypothetical protein
LYARPIAGRAVNYGFALLRASGEQMRAVLRSGAVIDEGEPPG